MEEIWKDIKGYEGLYQVSNFGNVKRVTNYVLLKNGDKRLVKGKIMHQRLQNKGYFQVGLCKRGKAKLFSVHRLVATAFIPNPCNLPHINHKDSNRKNNYVENLEWCTPSYNAKYSYDFNNRKGKMKWKTGGECCCSKMVAAYKDGRLVKIYDCISYASKELGILNSSISNCLKGRSNTAGGFEWKYI